eukprot:6492736-Amphidinium_carterae.2
MRSWNSLSERSGKSQESPGPGVRASADRWWGRASSRRKLANNDSDAESVESAVVEHGTLVGNMGEPAVEHSSSSALSGPRNFKEVAAVPNEVGNVIAARSKSMFETLRARCQEGLVVTTSYTGVGTGEDAVHRMVQSVLGRGATQKLHSYMGVELDTVPREFLLQKRTSPEHLCENVLDRLLPEDRAAVEAVTRKHLDEAMRLDRSSKEKNLRARRKEEMGMALREELCVLLAQCSFRSEVYCLKCHKECAVDPKKFHHGWHVEIAGITCKPWSRLQMNNECVYGQWLHEATLPCLTWLFWLRFCKPHIVIVECVDHLDNDFLFSVLCKDELYNCRSEIFSPVALGIPSQRLRKYMVCVRSDTFQIDRKPEQSYLEVFGRPLSCTSSVYHVASVDEIGKHKDIGTTNKVKRRQKLVSKTLKTLNEGSVVQLLTIVIMSCEVECFQAVAQQFPATRVDEVSFENLLQAAKRQRLLVYRDLRRSSELLNETAMCNLMQTAGHHKYLRPTVPALTKSTFLWELALDRPVLPWPEHWAIMGYDTTSDEFEWSEASRVMKSAAANRHRAVTGNMMHLAQVTTFLAYWLAQCQRVESAGFEKG